MTEEIPQLHTTQSEASAGRTAGEQERPAAPGSGDGVPVWLKVLVAALVLAVLGVSGLLAKSVFLDADGAATLTKAERDVIVAQAEVTQYPNEFRSRLSLARAYLGAGRLEEAIQEADKALELESRAVEAHVVKGAAYERLRRPAEAEKEYLLVLELVPNQYTANYRLADLYLDQGRPDDAVTQLEALLEGTPMAADALVLLGRAYEQKGEPQKARAQYEAALTYVPDYQEALIALERLEDSP
ncbi:MAG: hypothetical protein Kow00129_10840 [Thermoleophilia bacterium]